MTTKTEKQRFTIDVEPSAKLVGIIEPLLNGYTRLHIIIAMFQIIFMLNNPKITIPEMEKSVEDGLDWLISKEPENTIGVRASAMTITKES